VQNHVFVFRSCRESGAGIFLKSGTAQDWDTKSISEKCGGGIPLCLADCELGRVFPVGYGADPPAEIKVCPNSVAVGESIFCELPQIQRESGTHLK